jgi:hypothetical protein
MIRTLILGAALALSLPASAQSLEMPALSPSAEVMQTVGVTEITVNYSSPGKRDRTVWGDLVAYDELWRTGANSATTLETSTDITVGGEAVPAGKYALFTIPGEETWTVILNKNPDQGGTGQYDKALDQARFEVKAADGGARERLTFLFTDTTMKGTRLDLVWDGVRIEIPIEVDTDGMMADSIASFTNGTGRTFANAARYHMGRSEWEPAIALLDHSIGIEATWYNTWLKAEALHEAGTDNKTAYKLAQKAMKMGAEAENFFWKGKVEKAIAEWPKR